METSAVRSSECPVGKKTFATATVLQAKSCNKIETARSFGLPWMSCFDLLNASSLIRWHERETFLKFHHEFPAVVREMQEMSYMNLIGNV